MFFNTISRYKLSTFIIYFVSINTVIYFPFVIGFVLDFIEVDTSGLGGFIGFVFFPILIAMSPFLFMFSLFAEIRFLIKDLKLHKNSFFYHFFTLHISSHSLFLSLLFFFAIIKWLLWNMPLATIATLSYKVTEYYQRVCCHPCWGLYDFLYISNAFQLFANLDDDNSP